MEGKTAKWAGLKANLFQIALLTETALYAIEKWPLLCKKNSHVRENFFSGADAARLCRLLPTGCKKFFLVNSRQPELLHCAISKMEFCKI